ncbi:MAG TPA: hypothetical protein VIP70_02935 [Nitrososphaeraceae archaeon]
MNLTKQEKEKLVLDLSQDLPIDNKRGQNIIKRDKSDIKERRIKG